MKRIFAISDIHGCYKTLRALIEEQIQPGREDQLVFLGDYIDRGPDSKSVIDYLIGLKSRFEHTVFLRGNHEQMCLDSFYSEQAKESWLQNGGREMLISYGSQDITVIPEEHRSFLEYTTYIYTNHSAIFVHAGLNQSAVDPLKDYSSMMWIRHSEVTKKMTGGRYVIHGHTPTGLEEIYKQIDTLEIQLKLCLDNGCVFKGRKAGLGNLLSFELTGRTLWIQPNIDF